MGVACYYTAPDRPYVLPASDAPDVVVLAGHTWRGGDAAFNVLYDWRSERFGVRSGDELWVRTDASGGARLVYRADAFHTPAKQGGLAQDSAVWGTEPVPGRLLTIGCIQPTNLRQSSSLNAVVAWQFVRVEG